MGMAEHDIFIAYRGGAGAELAETIREGLSRRSFRVFAEPASAAPDGAERLRLIEETPDFVVILTPPAAGDTDADALRGEIDRALETDRNVIPVYAPGYKVAPYSDSGLAKTDPLATLQPVSYNPRSKDECIARIAHRLSSTASLDERRQGVQAKWIGLAALVIFVSIVAGPVSRAITGMFEGGAAPALPPFTLYWSAIGERVEQQRWAELRLEKDAPMNGGDHLKVLFSGSGDGHAYVMTRDVAGNITVLFPSPATADGTRVRAGQAYTAPRDGWLTIDDRVPVESVYVFASYDPIQNLESLMEEQFEESSPEARLGLLELTIAGLVDGRHAGGFRPRTRGGRTIAVGAEGGAIVRSLSTQLSGGDRVTHGVATERGLVSAFAEIRIRVVRR